MSLEVGVHIPNAEGDPDIQTSGTHRSKQAHGLQQAWISTPEHVMDEKIGELDGQLDLAGPEGLFPRSLGFEDLEDSFDLETRNKDFDPEQRGKDFDQKPNIPGSFQICQLIEGHREAG